MINLRVRSIIVLTLSSVDLKTGVCDGHCMTRYFACVLLAGFLLFALLYIILLLWLNLLVLIRFFFALQFLYLLLNSCDDSFRWLFVFIYLFALICPVLSCFALFALVLALFCFPLILLLYFALLCFHLVCFRYFALMFVYFAFQMEARDIISFLNGNKYYNLLCPFNC